MKDLDLRCKKCTAFLRVRPQSTFISKVVCSNSKCKFENNIKVVTSESSDKDIRYNFQNPNMVK